MDTAQKVETPAAGPPPGGPARPTTLSLVTAQRAQGTMPTSEDLSDWICAVGASGDRQAFAALFKHCAPRVKAYLIRLGSPAHLAEELAQETMINVWRRAPSFDAERAGALTWVFTIARNLRVDQFRRRGESLFQDLDTDTDDPEDRAAQRIPDPAAPLDQQLSTRQRERLVREALTRLAPEQAHILRLSFFEDHAHAKIAATLGLPLGTVKSRIRYAVQHLRRLMGDLEP